MQIDFTSLNNEYNAFWLLHNKSNALLSLNNIDNYISLGQGHIFLISMDEVIKANQLIALYAINNNLSVDEAVKTVSYNTAILWLESFLNAQIQDIVDLQSKIAAQSEYGTLTKILSTLGTAAKGTIKYIIVIAIAVLFLVIFKMYLDSHNKLTFIEK